MRVDYSEKEGNDSDGFENGGASEDSSIFRAKADVDGDNDDDDDDDDEDDDDDDDDDGCRCRAERR